MTASVSSRLLALAKGKQGLEDFARSAFGVFQRATGEAPMNEPPTE